MIRWDPPPEGSTIWIALAESGDCVGVVQEILCDLPGHPAGTYFWHRNGRGNGAGYESTREAAQKALLDSLGL